jgi:hypothetical protein
MIKKLLVVLLAALGIGLIGCAVEPDDTVDITLTSIPTVAGNNCEVHANIVGSSGVSNITPNCTKSDGTAAPTITFGNVPAPSGAGDLSFTMNVSSATCNGDYVLVLTATSGNKTKSKTTPFQVTGKTDCAVPVLDIRYDSATLGAFGNTQIGSSLDLDRDSVMLAKDAKLDSSGVDIVYNSVDSLTAVVYNPVYAKSIENSVFTGWVNPNDTKFHKVTADFDAITTAAKIAELYQEAKATEKRLTVSVNDLLIVKTDKGNYVLIKIKTTFPTASGIALLKYALKK